MHEIRTLLPQDEVPLQRMLERSFGHGLDWFRRHQPDLFGNEPDLLDCGLVAVVDGQIQCHVGTYPIEIVAGPARLMCGGIGDVATAPEVRGSGLMSQLLGRSIERMAQRGWPLSVLWGDAQRYGHFGYERAGHELRIDLTRRSMRGLEAAKVEEVDPTVPDVAQTVRTIYQMLAYRADRPRFERRLLRPGIRVFVGDDGYLITHGDRSGNQTVIEIASPTGRELELVLGVLDITFGQTATLMVEAEPSARIRRLLDVASSWTVQAQGLWRIVDWPKLLLAVEPLLQERAQGLEPFELAVGARWQDECEVASIRWDGSRLTVVPGREAEPYVEIGLRRLTRLVIGAPGDACPELGSFGRLLPLNLHLPRLDHV